MKKRIFIDTDLGIDDVIAIGLLFLSGKYTICGMSVVNGVSSVGSGTKNLNRLLKIMNTDIPLFQGISQKQQKSTKQFPSWDRSRAKKLTLIKSVQLPSGSSITRNLQSASSVFTQIEKPIVLFCIGPLSNIAWFTKKGYLDTYKRCLVTMGGAIGAKGNVKTACQAEYNIRLDPDAATQVFRSKIPKTIIPLDATSYVPAILQTTTLSKSQTALKNFLLWLRSFTPPTKIGKIIKDIILNNSGDFSSFYDPLAAAILIDPSIVKTGIFGDIVISKFKRTYAKTIFYPNDKSTTEVVLNVYPIKFYSLLKTLLQKNTG